MVKTVKYALLALVVLIPILCVGCGDLLPQAQQGIEQAQGVSKELDAVIADAEAEIAKLPPNDPARPGLVKRVAELKEVKAKVDKQIANGLVVIKDLQNGELSPEAVGIINTLPYGVYVTGIAGLVFAFIKRQKAKGLMEDLTKVVRSWEEVGPELSPEDKEAVAAIQGPKASKAVEAIKVKLYGKDLIDPTIND